ncbi:DUF3857 domain-containing transglutaminase family protein [Thauera sp.]|uniref:DUF3857 domain-containing transglutaminase family protein n=1 Tax=Thauera sp. TaxID=1905334 RepID=UPI0039E4BF55
MSFSFLLKSCSPRIVPATLVLTLLTPTAWATQPYTAGVVFERVHVDYEVARDGTYVRTAEIVKRLENAQGIEKEGKAQMAFQSGIEKAEFIDARVVQPDGREIVLRPDDVHLQEAYSFPEAAVFTDRKRMTLVFPDLQPGSKAIATTRSQQLEAVIPGQFSTLEWRSPHFGSLDTRIRFTVPADMPLHVDAHDAEVSREANGDKVTWTVKLKSVEQPWPSEPGSVAAVDYGPRVAVSTVADYGTFAAAYRDMIAGRDAVTPEIQALADELTAGKETPREQARALYEWVAGNIRYVAIHMGRGGWVPHAASEVLSRRYGDCKDHVTLLAALLRARGIDSSPVLLNAGNSYWLPQYPTLASFNHALLYLPTLDLYVDSTARYVDFGLLPFESAAKPALIVVDGRVVQTPAVRAQDTGASIVQRMTVDADGHLQGDTTIRSSGFAAQIDRAMMAQAAAVPDAQIAAAVLTNAGEHGQAQFRRPTNLALGEVAESGLSYDLTRGLDLRVPGHFSVTRGVGFGGIHAYGRAIMDSTRRAPFMCPATTMIEEQRITWPDSIKLGALPPNRRLVSEDAALPYIFTSNYALEGKGEVVIRRKLVVETASPVCPPASNAALQALAREIAFEYDAALSYAPR